MNKRLILVWTTAVMAVFFSNIQANSFLPAVYPLLFEEEAETDLPDTTAPDTDIDRPANGATVNGRSVYVTASASDDVGVTRVEFYVNGVLKSASVGPDYTYIWNTTAIADGVYTLFTRAYDPAGNVGESSGVILNVDNSAPDTTAPDVSITNPADNAIVGNTTVTIAAAATDNNAVSQVEFFVNGVSLAIDTTAPYEAPWDTAVLADDTYQLTATATDAVANVSTSAVTTVIVDSVLSAIVSSTPSLNFDGNDDYVDLNKMDIPGSALTIEAWFNSRDFRNCSSTDCRIVSKSDGTSDASHYWMISTTSRSSNPVLRFRLKTNGSTTTLIANSGNLLEDTWYHVAAVYDGITMKLYLDGVEVGSTGKSGELSTNGAIDAWIGGNPSGATARPWDGFIDEVRFWNVAKTQTEIADNKDSQVTPGQQGLVAYYKFNEGAGQAVEDSAGDNETVLGSSANVDVNDPAWFP